MAIQQNTSEWDMLGMTIEREYISYAIISNPINSSTVSA